MVAAALQSGAQEASQSFPPMYPYAADVAKQNDELALFRESNKTNESCAQAIDAAIWDSNYKLYHYDLPTAAMSVISEYGAERVQWVLASVVQRSEWDGRYSGNNKEWAKSFDTPHLEYAIVVNTHPAVLDGFDLAGAGDCAGKENAA